MHFHMGSAFPDLACRFASPLAFRAESARHDRELRIVSIAFRAAECAPSEAHFAREHNVGAKRTFPPLLHFVAPLRFINRESAARCAIVDVDAVVPCVSPPRVWHAV